MTILQKPVSLAIHMAAFLVLGLWAVMAEASSDEMMSKASDLKVPTSSLELYVVPLTTAQLAELADVWQGHTSDTMAKFIDLNVTLESLSGDAAEAARRQVATISEEQTRVAANYKVVISNWTVKGGSVDDIVPHQKFLSAMASATLKATDARTMAAIVVGWLGSRDGGLGLLIQVGVFLIALFVLLFIARFVRNLAARGLSRLPAMSKLLQAFVLTVVYWITVVVGLMVALGVAGVNVTPLFAVLGA